MKLRTLQCASCTAPLEVAFAATQATCEYCGSQAVLEGGGTAPDRRPDPVRELDQDWERQREELLRSVRGGVGSVPSMVGSVVVGLAFLGFGALWTILAANVGAPFPFPLFGVLWMVVVGVGMAGAVRRARRFASARDRFQSRRRSLLDD